MHDIRAYLGASLAVLLVASSSPAGAKELRTDAARDRSELRSKAPSLFDAAAEEFGVPADLLRAYAFVHTHWANTSVEHGSDDHSPAIYGIMGLHDGREGWFKNQVGRAAGLLGVTEDQIKDDPATNVRAAAALLSEEGRKSRTEGKGLESWARSIERMSAIPVRDSMDRFARKSESYEVLMTLVRGYDSYGISIPQRDLKIERAFTSDDLKVLKAPQVTREAVDSWDKTAGVDTLSDEMQTQAGPPDYPSALWNPTTCYTAGRTSATTHVAIHDMEGYYASTISWFKNCANNVSAHYLMRSSDGQITQMVRESDTAWHVKASNPYAVGIEHEGFANDASWYTDAMYNASAALTRSICDRLGIDKTKTYFGTAQTALSDVTYKVKGHVHFPNQTHTDPGVNWNWARYRSEVAYGTGVTYRAYVQNYAWLGWVNNWLGGTGTDAMAGTVGQSLRVEALQVQLQKAGGVAGSVCYQVHQQNYGWEAAVCDGAQAGVINQALRVEAMRVWLSGAPAGTHVCYRAQVEALGWLGEVCDGADAGTTGQNLRLETFQVRIWK